MPRIVKIASALIGLAAVFSAIVAIGAAAARNHADAARASLADAAGSAGSDLAATVHSALGQDIVIGIACAVILAIMAFCARLPSGRMRLLAWCASFLALVATSLSVGEDPGSAVSAGGFSNLHMQDVADHLLPGWYPWIVQLGELGTLAALVATLIALVRSTTHDYYRQGKLGDDTGMWSFVARENDSRNG